MDCSDSLFARWGHALRRANWLFLIAGTLLASGCADDSTSTPTGSASLTFTASSGTTPAALTKGLGALTLPSGMTVDEMWIAIGEIEFEQEGEDMDDETDDPEFEGPYVVNLVDSTGILGQSLGDTTIPAGTYEGVEFDMTRPAEPDADPTDNIYDRSLFISGTLVGVQGSGPFEIWHQTTEEFFITGPNGFVVDEGATGNSLVVDFNLDALFTGIDFTTAQQDGSRVYDINPDSATQANQDLADSIKTNLAAAADFGEDEDDDGDLDETEDVDDD